MLYLFNSAYRPGHLKNVLNTMFLPDGCINDYRYKVPRNVNPNIQDEISKGDPSVIVFVDRYAVGGYRYYPLRFGQLTFNRKDQDQLYFSVELGAFVYPNDLERWHRDLTEELNGNMPKCVQGDPESKYDGIYASLGENVLIDVNAIFDSEDSWVNCVDAIARCKALSSDEKAKVIFLRARLFGKRLWSWTAIKPGRRNHRFGFISGKSYELRIAYRFPLQEKDSGSTAKLRLNGLEPVISGHQDTQIHIDKLADTLKFPFQIKRKTVGAHGTITVAELNTDSASPTNCYPTAQVPYCISNSWFFHFLTIFAIIVLMATLFFLSEPFGKSDPAIKALIATINAVTIYLLTRMLSRHE